MIVVDQFSKTSNTCIVFNALYPDFNADSHSIYISREEDQHKNKNELFIKIDLFCLLTNNGTIGKNLDPDLTSKFINLF